MPHRRHVRVHPVASVVVPMKSVATIYVKGAAGYVFPQFVVVIAPSDDDDCDDDNNDDYIDMQG